MLSLHSVMRANAISCILFGLLFSILPSQVATFLSPQQSAPYLVVLILGLVLIVNGLHLLWAASKEKPNKYLVWYFSAGDFIWVMGSLGLIVANLWITTSLGIAATIVVAITVGLFGVMQLKTPDQF
ncbi:hypothetical protein [Paraglaciecola sp.]|uniref:hypothetical protein n=1 Tax=Paraglaciecola sp. TaxID=1920173 RepID=UPI003EF55652